MIMKSKVIKISKTEINSNNDNINDLTKSNSNVHLDRIDYVCLETTNYCNLKCSFCNREDVVDKLEHISIESWAKLLDKIKDEPVKEAKFTGMGEPLLHPKFDILCKMFKEVFPEAFLIVATNCQYKITPKFQNMMKYVDLLYLSIDGYKDSYERDRAPAKWSKLMTFFQEFKNIDRSNCRVTINYVVNPDNVSDIQKVHDEILLKYNLEELRLNIAQDWSTESNMSNTVGGYSEESIRYLKENWKENIKGKSQWEFNHCFWPRRALYTTVDGRVLMCALNTDASPFGNIFTDTLDEIRLSKAYGDIREGCSKNKPSNHCKNCSYKELNPILDKLGISSSH